MPPAARHVMYGLLGTAYGMNILARFSVGFLAPAAAAAHGFSEREAAILLGAFFPGYVLAMMPASFAIRALGEKAAVAANLLGTGAAFLVMPAAARIGALPLAACLSLMGAVQGCIVPCVIGLQTAWIPPEGVEKVWAIRTCSLALVVWQMLASFLTPRLTRRHGFGAAAAAYGVLVAAFGVVWCAWAEDRPRKWRRWPRMTAAERGVLRIGDAVDAAAGPARGLSPLQLLRIRSARAVIGAAGCFGAAMYAIMPIAPTYYQQELGVSAEVAGSHLALVPLVAQATDLLIGVTEAALIRAGWSTLCIRRAASCAAYAMSAVGLSLFAFATTARRATAAYMLATAVPMPLHFQSGFGQSYREVGGPDSGTLAALCNTLANLSGWLLPLVGYWLRRRTGSWRASFLWPVVVQLAGGLMWWSEASVTPARETFLARAGTTIS
jgi:hypothetical protein